GAAPLPPPATAAPYWDRPRTPVLCPGCLSLVPFKKYRTRIEWSETSVILSLAVPPKPCTPSASRRLVRERETRGIPLVGSCATCTCTRPSDTDGRSLERETFEKDETAPWVLLYQPLCRPNKMSRLCHTSGL